MQHRTEEGVPLLETCLRRCAIQINDYISLLCYFTLDEWRVGVLREYYKILARWPP